MRTAHILLLCILGAALLSPVLCNHGFNPDKCCFKYYPDKIWKGYIASYYKTHENCPKPAAILVMKKSRLICVDPSQQWVVSVMKHLDGVSR